MVILVPYGGELVDRLVALAATEWKWLPRRAQEETPTPLSTMHRRAKVTEEKTSQKEG